jgi:hypothetical protein
MEEFADVLAQRLILMKYVNGFEQGRELGATSFEPIYYLVFHPRQMLEVKRLTQQPGSSRLKPGRGGRFVSFGWPRRSGRCANDPLWPLCVCMEDRSSRPSGVTRAPHQQGRWPIS